MTMAITIPQVEAALADITVREGLVQLCETNSPNRHVELGVEYNEDEDFRYVIHNGRQRVGIAFDVEAAVVIFNYYAGRYLGDA